ncbi:rhodanese domain containing protein [Sporothrix brasiliensis 5110]|uniref:Rhodanese domain containing protein n=1 Tax=Sporothrix brasiliensis 5110 TaxID=1398154 RepID=A0A0C2IPS8_9PEZI|nr:rhodanese domain containing protein [Sporothrix brasiliensis 5110]KIH88945.1 rhodanese domain containing protein [Sporothrix brasiliensis 5110]
MASTVNRRAARAVSALLRQTVARSALAATSPAAAIVTTAARRSSLSLLVRRAYSSSTSADHKIWSFEEVQELVKKSDSPIVIVDTREPGELKETGRIPGAINIPVTTSPDGFFLPDEEFEDRFGFVRPSRDTEVIFYCKAGVRSRAAAGLAKEAGWTKVGEYPGSWNDWAGKGGTVQR